MTSIAHLTSVHPRYDTRIFLKMCRSLAAAGQAVTLVVADGWGDEEKDGVRILDAGASRGRLDRMLGATRRVQERALSSGADIFHLHDPELLPVGLALKRRGKIVVFDAHEDLPLQVLGKPYLPKVTRGMIGRVAAVAETIMLQRLDHVIGATPAITDKFERQGLRCTNVNNYPILGELDIEDPDSPTLKERRVCYVGAVSATRGIFEIVSAIGLTKSEVRLSIAGHYTSSSLKRAVQEDKAWEKVDDLGYLAREDLGRVLRHSIAGLVVLHPTPAYVDSLPVKMFEYMAAGIPVIASDIPLWRQIIEESQCGVCVDPFDPKAIAEAIDSMATDERWAAAMGERGRLAMRERFNWGKEEKKLMAVYDSVCS